MTTHSLDDIYTYQSQALDLLKKDHPHYDEIRKLLIEQVTEMVYDYTNSRAN